MKKYIKLILFLLFIAFIFLLIFNVSRRISLNNFLDKTIATEKKINYSTTINLDISNSINSSRIEYDIVVSPSAKKITINNYINNEFMNSIYKYNVLNGEKKGIYKYDGKKYIKTNEEKDEFNINYDSLKKNIISIKKIENIVIDDISYKKYVVKMKAYDAYNIIYNDDILKKEDINKNIDVTIIIDKSNKFVYKISYKIDNINNSKQAGMAMEYNAEIINKDINNHNIIELPF
ncbi:MAG: hypothetical protein J6J17_02250 [Bacilli bacterium]|nr:hypothetical protein [Bacilli bacterium]